MSRRHKSSCAECRGTEAPANWTEIEFLKFGYQWRRLCKRCAERIRGGCVRRDFVFIEGTDWLSSKDACHLLALASYARRIERERDAADAAARKEQAQC